MFDSSESQDKVNMALGSCYLRGAASGSTHRAAPMARTTSLKVCLGFLFLAMACSLVSGKKGSRKCEEITIPMCHGIGYNLTHMPNQFNHDTQEEAGLEVHQFWPLVEIQCSPDLKFFLCSMYAPICMTNYHKSLPACRTVCERAKSGCAPLMRQYGFAWPERMRCDDLPEYGDKDQLCMDFNTTENKPTPPPKNVLPPPDSTGKGDRGGKPGWDNHPVPTGDAAPGPMDCQCRCRNPLVRITNSTHALYGKVSIGDQPNCAMACEGAYFSKDEKTFAQFWIGLWSVLCCVSTTMTVFTFLADMQRFKYPERPIIFLSACYTMVSIGYIIRLVVGHEAVACEDYMGAKIIRYETTGPAVCTVVFLLIYFFGMASSLWWVILSFTWFLAAGLKWGQEAIASYSQYFHLAAWLTPSIKSIAILAMSSVDGDPIAGVCFVGNQNIDNLRGFVLAPLCVYLLLGFSFLLAGFVSLFRIRNVIKQQGRGKTDKLEKLMIRIGVFSVLYTVPATIVIACYFYEQYFKERWERSHNCPCEEEDHMVPDYSIFMLKYFMCLVVGITSGFWIWSGKTLQSWRNCYGRCCGKPQYHQPVGRLPPAKYTNPSYQTASQCGSSKTVPLSHV